MTGAVLTGTTSVTGTGTILAGTTNDVSNPNSTVVPTGAIMEGATLDPSAFELDYQVGPELTPEQLVDYVLSYANVDGNDDGARDDAVIMDINGTATVSVVDNDSVLHNTVVINQPPQFGTAVVNSNRQIVYSPNADFTGLDLIGYSLIRNGLAAATADVVIGVFESVDAGSVNGGTGGSTTGGSTGGSTGGTTGGGTTVVTGGGLSTVYAILTELRGCDADVGDMRLAINALIRQHNQIQSIQSGSVTLRSNPPAADEEAAKRVTKHG